MGQRTGTCMALGEGGNYLVTFEEACSADQRLQLQSYVLLMMGAMDARNM